MSLFATKAPDCDQNGAVSPSLTAFVVGLGQANLNQAASGTCKGSRGITLMVLKPRQGCVQGAAQDCMHLNPLGEDTSLVPE